MERKYRKLTDEEIASLESHMCMAEDWSSVEVAETFSTEYVRHARFSGKIRIGNFSKVFELAGGMKKHSGLYHVTLHDVSVGDDCCIENVKNYIANYIIGDRVFIENVDIILTDSFSSFGNGVEVAVLNETGGREVVIYDALTSQIAYVMANSSIHGVLNRKLRDLIGRYVRKVSSTVGYIGDDAVIADAGYIKNVKVGECCKIEGTSRLKNGSVNSTRTAPVHIGVNVVGDDFIISSGASVEDGVTFSRCFIGQACRLGHNYSALDSLFFCNCQGENGEACSVFAGPFTVTHHKSTLLISGMFSFMNAGSGSNQSNHLYKLGPIHHGVLERGSKTASDSYILWPSKVGAFSLVMGRHVSHQDTTCFPFSYLIEQQNTTYIMPGANLKSIGTIRDAMKWPKRDARTGSDKLDQVNFNLLSPYTVQKMIAAIKILEDLQRVSGSASETYSFQNGLIKRSSMLNALRYYRMAVDKFLGNALIARIQDSGFMDIAGLRSSFYTGTGYGEGEWTDISGLIAPENAVSDLYADIESGLFNEMEEIRARFESLHSKYKEYEWKWACNAINDYYGIDLASAEYVAIRNLVLKWKEAVVGLDRLILEDARKELALKTMTGASDEKIDVVQAVQEHIRAKSELADKVLELLDGIK